MRSSLLRLLLPIYLLAHLLVAGGCISTLAEDAVKAPNLNPHPMVRPPVSEELLGTLQSAQQLYIPVGPPDATLSIWITQGDPAEISVAWHVTPKKVDVKIRRTPATHPSTRPLAKGATIFLLHGIQDHQELEPYLLYKEALTSSGYRVVQVDLRGHGQSTGQWITYGVVESRDLVQVLDELQASGLVDGPVGVMGLSYGAAVAIEWAAIDPRVKSVVALEPFASFRDAAHSAAPMVLGRWKWLFSSHDIDRAVDMAGKMASFDPDQASPLKGIAALKTPVLLIHSKDDELIAYSNSQRLHAADPDHSGLITVNKQSHFWMWLQSVQLILGASTAWFHRDLGMPESTQPTTRREDTTMFKQPLHEGWTVQATSNLPEVPSSIRDKIIPARVPGCIHTDLLRAGLIEDPYYGKNEPKLFWIGRTDWQYTTYFEAKPVLFDNERIDLVCDGLDTVATILLNGSEVARTQNMHRGYRFDVRPFLKKGRNELTVQFESPLNYAERMRDKLGHLPAILSGGPFNFIRKMACNFGWDWGPIVPTCGIWRGVRLEGWSRVRIDRVAPQYNPDGRGGIDFLIDLEWTSEPCYEERWQLAAKVSEEVGGRDLPVVVQTNFEEYWSRTSLSVLFPYGRQAILWWPLTHGAPFLYNASVEIKNTEGSERSNWAGRIGLRTVELDTSPDDIGRQFVVKVNGKPIFCKGFNWIPDDCFLDRACEPVRVRKRIQQAVDANANMLRVWGGGIYETDDFYDICDELGILVWQDFLFACAAYPEEEPFKSEVEAEARYNVARLAHHPSLVLWNGCNENLWGFHEWSSEDGDGVKRPWKEQLKGKKWGTGYYLDLLPRIVEELDPSRPYWAASPWSGDPDVEHGLHPNLETHGNKHIWEVWHGPGDYSNYRRFSPRFCSEFGYQGPANCATMRQYFDPAELKRGSKTLELHQKSPGGNERNDRLLSKDFDIPDNFDDWHYLLQLNQARALKAGVEWFRSRQPVCMGTLYWQLNDCYPVTSWSAIDCDGRLKPLWYATREFYSPRLVTIQPEDGGLALHVINDCDLDWAGNVMVNRFGFGGQMLATLTVPIDLKPRRNFRAHIPPEIAAPGDRHAEFLVALTGELQATWFFASDRELAYPAPAFQSSLERDGEAWLLKITAESLLRDVVINIDRIDPEATINRNLVTIPAGESVAFRINLRVLLDQDQLISPPVFQCANRFGRR